METVGLKLCQRQFNYRDFVQNVLIVLKVYHRFPIPTVDTVNAGILNNLSAALVIIEASQLDPVIPECILIACLVRPSIAAGVCPFQIPRSLSDRVYEDER